MAAARCGCTATDTGRPAYARERAFRQPSSVHCREPIGGRTAAMRPAFGARATGERTPRIFSAESRTSVASNSVPSGWCSVAQGLGG